MEGVSEKVPLLNRQRAESATIVVEGDGRTSNSGVTPKRKSVLCRQSSQQLEKRATILPTLSSPDKELLYEFLYATPDEFLWKVKTNKTKLGKSHRFSKRCCPGGDWTWKYRWGVWLYSRLMTLCVTGAVVVAAYYTTHHYSALRAYEKLESIATVENKLRALLTEDGADADAE